MGETQSPISEKRANSQGKHTEASKSQPQIMSAGHQSPLRSPSQLIENSNDIINSFIPDGTSKLATIFNDIKEDEEPLRTADNRSGSDHTLR